MNSEVHILHRVHDYVDELHTGHLEKRKHSLFFPNIFIEPQKIIDAVYCVSDHFHLHTRINRIYSCTFIETDKIIGLHQSIKQYKTQVMKHLFHLYLPFSLFYVIILNTYLFNQAFTSTIFIFFSVYIP